MSETRTTLYYCGAAIVLALVAFSLAPSPITPEAFLDQGEPFFPEFTDPNEATTLEVIDFDDATGSARPFKVTFNNDRWTVPSHHGYQADAKDRLAKTAAGVMDIKKDDFRTDNVADHGRCAVVDPLDETATGLSGRGKRVTLKGADGKVLADFIVGKGVLSRPGFRFVRVPGQNRVYAARMDVDLSTRFEDWINRDLLQVEKEKINRITLKDYSIDERSLTVDQRDNLILTLKDAEWKANKMSGKQAVDSLKMKELLTALDDLSIVGVRPKPDGLSASLKGSSHGPASLSTADQLSLQRKGFYLSRDGQLLSNEGELEVETTEGVVYTLRFGEVLYGSGLSVTAGSDRKSGVKDKGAESRYLFVSTYFDEDVFGKKPPRPANDDFLTKADSLWTDKDRSNKERQDKLDRWTIRFDNARELSETLNARFADWYYVISASNFDKLRLDRKDLMVSKG